MTTSIRTLLLLGFASVGLAAAAVLSAAATSADADAADTRIRDDYEDGIPPPPKKKPNILFISVDDLNIWVGYMTNHTNKGHPESLTPNIDRLSAMGLSFTNAHASSTVCNPSRTAVWSGVRPSTSGCYDNQDHPWTSYIRSGMGINAHFKRHGYHVAGAGKTYHESSDGFDKPERIYVEDWDEYPAERHGYDKQPDKREGFNRPCKNTDKLRDEDDQDWHTVSYCIDRMLNGTEYRGGDSDSSAGSTTKPLFLACGIKKPHLPWSVPAKYYPSGTAILPPYPSTNDVKDWEASVWEDLADISEFGIKKFSDPGGDHLELVKKDRWADSLQSYRAAISYMDMNVGRLVDALEEFEERDNTIVVLWSDHGYHHGEKAHHKKSTLWRESSDVPFIWIVPGVTTPNTICDRSVDLQSLYPTLCDLAGLPIPFHVDGDNIRSLLQDPEAEWEGIAKITMKYQNHAIVDQRYRYIRYLDGSEELYDHDVDPHEFINLASDSQYNDIKTKLSEWLPQVNMERWHDDKDENVEISCNHKAKIVKKCRDGKSFVARDPNNMCKFVACPNATSTESAPPLIRPSPDYSQLNREDATEEPTTMPTIPSTSIGKDNPTSAASLFYPGYDFIASVFLAVATIFFGEFIS